MPSNLVVESTHDGDPIGAGWVAESLRIAALDTDRWMLLMDGAPAAGGPPETLRVGISPADLALRCAAAVGAPRRSILGVVTPALVVAGLQ